MLIPGIPYFAGVSDHGTSAKYGIVIHCTANTATARDEAGYATRRTDGIGGHFYADDTEVIQSLDTQVKTWHTGNVGNTVGIAVEVVGLVDWSRDRWLASVDFDKLAAVLAVVARAHGIPAQWLTVTQLTANPQAKGFYTHNDTRLAWGGTTHTDPGPGFPKDHLLACVRAAMDGDDMDPRDVWYSASADCIQRYNADGTPVTSGNTKMTAGYALGFAAREVAGARRDIAAVRVEMAALRSVVESLAGTLRAGGGSVDTAAILAGVDLRVTAAVAEVADELAGRLAA